jgi:hypothetical protein
MQASLKRDRRCIIDARAFATAQGIISHEIKTFGIALQSLKIARMMNYFGHHYAEFYTLDEALENI